MSIMFVTFMFQYSIGSNIFCNFYYILHMHIHIYIYMCSEVMCVNKGSDAK
jgi:hypothetical protein